MCLPQARGFSPADFRFFHPGGNLGGQLKWARDLTHAGEEVPTITMPATLGAAIVERPSRRFGITGVVDEDGRLAGVLTDGDLRRSFLIGMRLELAVTDVMTRDPRTTSPTALAADLLGILTEQSITNVFVVEEDGRSVGVLLLHDLLHAEVIWHFEK